MKRLVMFTGLALLLGFLGGTGWAFREAFTPEQREKLAKVQTVLVEVLALTEKGSVDSAPLLEVVARRMKEVGYNVVTDPAQPHDVAVRVKCEERKVWEGTTPMGGDADLPDSPSRLWKGPACQINYSLGGTKVKWQKEVRTEFEDALKAANGADPGAYAMTHLKERLELYDFPVLLTAEWGQAKRLIKLLDDPATSHIRRVKLISVLGEMANAKDLPPDAVSALESALKDVSLAKQAAVALANMGKEHIPMLIDMFKTATQPELQAAAAKALGQIGALHGDPRIIPPLLEKLDAPGMDITVQTEIAWALGKLPDKRSVKPLYALDRKLQKIRSDDPLMKKLKEAVFWAIKQCDTEDQYS